MRRHLVFVHGRDFKPGPETLWPLWRAALERSIARFYDHALEAFQATPSWGVHYGDLTRAQLERRGRRYEEAADLADRRSALAELSELKKRQFLARSTYERLPGRTSLKEFAADVGLPLLGRLGLAEPLIRRVAPELPSYWADEGGYATETRRRLSETLAPLLADGEPRSEVMLVTHCLGSVIAWDVLWELTHAPPGGHPLSGRISVWLTLGSPLGDETVKRRLRGAGEPPGRRHPANVTRWANVAAEDDYISHDKRLANDYGAMVTRRSVRRIRDYRIYNPAVRFGRSNPHSALGYLAHPRVAKLVSDWLTRPADPATG